MTNIATAPPVDQGTALPRLMGIDELAAYLAVPVQTIYYWRHRGTAPRAIYVGRHLRWREDDVLKWLAECDTDAA